MALRCVQGDITKMRVDAIVNAANSGLRGGGGVDGAIHAAGGPEIMAECREIIARQGSCPPGTAVITTAGLLPAKWVVHTVGPIWTSEQADAHDQTLASCYRRSLDVAANAGARTVAFPNISTGVYGFPKPRACEVAVGTTREWMAANPGLFDEVVFACFDDENFDLYRRAIGDD